MISHDQQARNLLERCGWKSAQNLSNVSEIANLLAELDHLRRCITERVAQGETAEKIVIEYGLMWELGDDDARLLVIKAKGEHRLRAFLGEEVQPAAKAKGGESEAAKAKGET